jgi:hypothetical protein
MAYSYDPVILDIHLYYEVLGILCRAKVNRLTTPQLLQLTVPKLPMPWCESDLEQDGDLSSQTIRPEIRSYHHPIGSRALFWRARGSRCTRG